MGFKWRLWMLFRGLTLLCAVQILFHLGAFLSHCSSQLAFSRKGERPIESWKVPGTKYENEFDVTAPTKLQSPTKSNNSTCISQNRILFLKTHKTGSSTIANILFRYGDTRNLTFLLPHATFFDWPNPFNAFAAFPTYGETPDILCSHARFNSGPMHWFFPKDQTRYITILREPVHHFESVFDFMDFETLLKLYGDPNPLASFLRNPKSFHELWPFRRTELSLIRNPLFFDLGLQFKYYQNLTAVEKYIQFLEYEFDLVMITEYFDESLVLLKRLLCWEIEDVLFFKMNERQGKEKQTALSEEVKANIKRWNAADVLLYNHFNNTFWKKVSAEGPGFYRDLENMKSRRKEMERKCLSDEERIVRTYAAKFVRGHSLRNDLPEDLRQICARMTWTENFYLKYLRDKLIRKHADIAQQDLEQNSKKIPVGWNTTGDLEYQSVSQGSHAKEW